MTESNLNILKKLHAIMSELDYIQKDSRNEFHKYSYASEKAIKEAVHPLLVKHGVLFVLSGHESERSGEFTTAKFNFRFIDVETGEQLELFLCGQGQDKGDKGYWKAVTGAIKYILTSTFLIPTGDDPEADTKTDQPPSLSPPTVTEREVSEENWLDLTDFAKEKGWDKKATLALLRTTGANTPEELTRNGYALMKKAIDLGKGRVMS